MRRGGSLWLLFLLAGASVAGCVAPAPPVALSGGQSRTVAAAQAYLDGLAAFQARFSQTGWLGSGAGTLWVARPGRLRMIYDGPAAKDMTANKGVFTVLDRSDGATTTTPVARTPLGLLLNKPLTFSGAVTVTGFVDDTSSVIVTLQDATHPAQGSLTVQLRKAPLLLVGLAATDARGRTLTLHLTDLQLDPPITPWLFILGADRRGSAATALQH